jgi:hypothetical protein
MDKKKICEENPNVEFFREVIRENLPLMKMLATNGKHESDVSKTKMRVSV